MNHLEVEERLKNVILPEEIDPDEYEKVVNYLIAIGFFKYLFKKDDNN